VAMGMSEIVAAVVACVGVGMGIHELYLHHGPTWIWDVAHKLEESSEWAHPAPFDPSKVRRFDNTTKQLTDEECDFLVDLTKRTHDWLGYAKLRGIPEDDYLKLESATEKVISYINGVSGRHDAIDHMALRRTPRKGVKAHADNVRWEPSNQTWIPNNSGHRTWSASTLLNDPHEYDGGTFRFHEPTRHDVRPGKGQTIVFDGSERNVHSVDTVPYGDRYVLLVWLSERDGEHRRKLMW